MERRTRQGERGTTKRLSLQPAVTQGKSQDRHQQTSREYRECLQWNQFLHFGASFVKENASIFRKLKLRLCLIFEFLSRHRVLLTQLHGRHSYILEVNPCNSPMRQLQSEVDSRVLTVLRTQPPRPKGGRRESRWSWGRPRRYTSLWSLCFQFLLFVKNSICPHLACLILSLLIICLD